MVSSWNGITWTSSIRLNTVPRPRNCSRASAYPVSTPKTSVPRMTPPVKMPEFSSDLPRWIAALISA
jgi:hypothetical protein